MEIGRINLSNIYQHWYDKPWKDCYEEILTIPGVDLVALQVELIETLTNLSGHAFAPDNKCPVSYLRANSMPTIKYVDAIWGPSADSLSVYRGNETDARWLEKLLANALVENPAWRLPSYSSDATRYVTNAANEDCRAFVISLLTGTHPQAASMAGVDTLYMDDMNLYRMSTAEMEGWFEIIEAIHDAGIKVILNGGWNMKPYDKQDEDYWPTPFINDIWAYPAAEHLRDGSGVMVEYYVEHLTGMSTVSGWWELTEERFRKLCKDMKTMDIPVYMVVRWSGVEAGHNKRTDISSKLGKESLELQAAEVALTYEEFMRPMMDLCQEVGAIFLPSMYNYIDNPYEPFMARYQEPKSFEERCVNAANDAQLISLNPYALLQKAALADGFSPVSNSFDIVDVSGEYGDAGRKWRGIKTDPLAEIQGEFPNPRAYMALIPIEDGEQWGEVIMFSIPR